MSKAKIDKKEVKNVVLNIFYPMLALAIVLAVWAIWAAAKDAPYLVPAPAVVLREFFLLGGKGEFWLAVLGTVGRTLLCFVASFVLALALASLGGIFRPLHRVMSPIVSILRAAPTVAVILILYAFMDKQSMSVAVGFLIAFPVLYSAFFSAIDGVDAGLLNMAKAYKVRTADRIFMIYLPCIADTLFDSGRATLSLTLKVVVAAEILTNLAGSIGHSIQISYAAFEISSLFAWTLVAIVFSFALEGAVLLLKKIWEATR